MPYIDLLIEPAPTPAQATRLAQGLTDAMVEVGGKRRAVTAVRIAAADSALWSIGGERCPQATAYLDVKVTEGSNSREEKAALVERFHRLLVETLGELAEASYIAIHELPAESWGYGGLTQAARGGRP